eukprot:TRINITY_DN10936_c0_g1_i1.p1 TRINITY_DN10936_c0_g1~~TRINITY_DN10936_c0_g1_i1.p1  ORF type:complete len:134 (-),score=4.27 TRINITY_DN10936_c0_g1_i1:121-522(-)
MSYVPRFTHQQMDQKIVDTSMELLLGSPLLLVGVFDLFLGLVHAGNLLRRGGILRLFIVSDTKVARKAQGNAFVRVHQANSSLMTRRDGQVCRFDLPNLNGLKPFIGFGRAIVAIVRWRRCNPMLFEEAHVCL